MPSSSPFGMHFGVTFERTSFRPPLDGDFFFSDFRAHINDGRRRGGKERWGVTVSEDQRTNYGNWNLFVLQLFIEQNMLYVEPLSFYHHSSGMTDRSAEEPFHISRRGSQLLEYPRR